jgi:hypothetical protein
MAHAHCVLQTLGTYNTYCFSTTATVMRTRLSVMLHARCSSCYIDSHTLYNSPPNTAITSSVAFIVRPTRFEPPCSQHECPPQVAASIYHSFLRHITLTGVMMSAYNDCVECCHLTAYAIITCGSKLKVAGAPLMNVKHKIERNTRNAAAVFLKSPSFCRPLELRLGFEPVF